MNIAIGKFGRSINFKESNWSAVGGDNEPPTLFLKLAELNSNNTYYLIGKSNFRKMDNDFKNKYKNIIDLWEFYDKEKDDNITFLYDYISKNNIKIDCGILFAGPTSAACMNNVLKNKKGEYCKPLNCFLNYAGPIVDYLNKSQIKYISLVPDPRYNPIPARELYNRPVYNLSQYDEENISIHIKSYDDLDFIEENEKTTYNDIEKMFFIGKNKLNFNNLNKNIKMMIVLNEGGNGGLKRGPILKEYILNNFNDIEIYGKWADKWYEDKRFKGPKKFIELQNLLPNVKYTFIIPIQKGWVTAKFWEMINYGIIPFMHPYYDEQNHINCPDFIRVKSPEELLEKINYLENNEFDYKKLLKSLQDLLKDEYYNGEYINNLLNEKIKEMI